ncbi:MAG: DNA-protecting protein DprA [Chitinophagaceae bacterium]|nr:DNA-protecting protein DprA [Chitinophagaceae bacterium]
MQSSEQLYRIALTLIPNIGNVLAKNLVSYCGSAERIFKSRKHDLLRVPGVDEVRAKSILSYRNFSVAEEEIEFIGKNKIKMFFYLDDDYPSRLKAITDGPVMLYAKGNVQLNNSRMIAIVGTRHASEYGRMITETLIEDLKQYDVTILSGLAYGIDICAHRAAVNHSMSTIGVLAHGLNRLYPAQHRATAIKMLEQGGLITEFRSSDSFDRENFPKRNRIVAGLADATIVIESAVKGGALITAEIANSYNRDVFAVPGRVGDKFSEGCNYFIKSNKANLVECANDIAYLSGWIDKKFVAVKQKEIFIELNEQEKRITEILSASQPMHVDEIARLSNQFGSKLAASLLGLEFKAVVIALPGKLYKLS